MKFTPEMFSEDYDGVYRTGPEYAAHLAQTSFDKWLGEQKIVEGRRSIWHLVWADRWENGREDITHTARLVEIREVKK